nr:hypothetical protein [Fodinicola feengrottensis]
MGVGFAAGTTAALPAEPVPTAGTISALPVEDAGFLVGPGFTAAPDVLADGEAPGLGDALPDGFGDALVDGLGVTAGMSATVLITWRNRSWAVCPTLANWSAPTPATVTTMLRSPSVTTSGSATPSAFTRWSMMLRASARLSWDGAFPSCVVAVSVSVVPPTRSRPSCGNGCGRCLESAPGRKNTPA